MFSTIIRVCCDGGMGNTHIGSRKKDWIVERECKGYLRRGRDKSSVTTKIVALQPQGWEVVNNNYPKGLFFFQFRARSISRCQVTIKKREKKGMTLTDRGEMLKRAVKESHVNINIMLLRTYAPLLWPSPILQAHPPHDDQYLSKTCVSLMTHH